MPPVFRLGPPKWVCLAKRHGGFIVLHYRYFVAVGKRAPSRRKRAYFTAEFKSIYGDRARVLRPLLARISLLNKVSLRHHAVKLAHYASQRWIMPTRRHPWRDNVYSYLVQQAEERGPDVSTH